MKFLLVLTILLATPVVMTAQTSTSDSTKATYVSFDEITASLAKATGGAFLVRDPNWRVAINRRGVGKPEGHAQAAHVWIIIEGEATVVTGGTVVDRTEGRGGFSGSSIQGGETHHLKKGDVITIPAGTPHWVKECPTQTIAFYVFNLGIGPP